MSEELFGRIFYEANLRYASINGLQVVGRVRLLIDHVDDTAYLQIISIDDKVLVTHYVQPMSFLAPNSAAGVAWSTIPYKPEFVIHEGEGSARSARSFPISSTTSVHCEKVEIAQVVFRTPGEAQKFKTVLDAIRSAFESNASSAPIAPSSGGLDGSVWRSESSSDESAQWFKPPGTAAPFRHHDGSSGAPVSQSMFSRWKSFNSSHNSSQLQHQNQSSNGIGPNQLSESETNLLQNSKSRLRTRSFHQFSRQKRAQTSRSKFGNKSNQNVRPSEMSVTGSVNNMKMSRMNVDQHSVAPSVGSLAPILKPSAMTTSQIRPLETIMSEQYLDTAEHSNQQLNPSARPSTYMSQRISAQPSHMVSQPMSANMSVANMSAPHMSAVNMSAPHMSAVNMAAPHMSTVNMSQPHMSAVNMPAPHMSAVHMSPAEMSAANMSVPQMSAVHMTPAELSAANMPVPMPATVPYMVPGTTRQWNNSHSMSKMSPAQCDPYAIPNSLHQSGEDPYCFPQDEILFFSEACLINLDNKTKSWQGIYKGLLKVTRGQGNRFSISIENDGHICKHHILTAESNIQPSCLTQFGFTYSAPEVCLRKITKGKEKFLVSFRSRPPYDEFKALSSDIMECLQLEKGDLNEPGDSDCCFTNLCDPKAPPNNWPCSHMPLGIVMPCQDHDNCNIYGNPNLQFIDRMPL